MKIVYVYPQFAHHAGTERILIDKMNYLAEKEGYDIIMLTYEQAHHEIAYPLSPKVRHVDLGVCFYPLYRYNRLTRFFKWKKKERQLQRLFNAFMASERPDIVVSVTYFAEVLSLEVQCPVKFVKVLESHIGLRYILNNDSDNRKSLIRWLGTIQKKHLLIKNAKKCDVIVALNKTDSDDWSRYLKSTIIPNMVHLNTSGLYSKHDSKRVIFAGRLCSQKAVFDLLKVWRLVNERHPDWQLDLYGEGEDKDRLMMEIAEMNANVQIYPPTDDIFKQFIDSSIFVLTSLYEPFGLVIPEAMSCGLPVVSFEGDGPCSIITDGVDGFLIKNRSIEDFADKVCLLMEDDNLRRTMGEAGIKSSQRYSAEKIMPMWKELFESLT